MRKHILRIIGGLTIVLSLLLTGCQGEGQTSENEVISTKLTMGFIPNIQFAPVYVALEKGYFQEAGFDVDLEYGDEPDAVALVGAGEQTFAIASGEQVLLAREQDLPVTYVAAWYQEFPVGIASLAEANILAPEDLEGQRVGIPGLYGASYIGFKALLQAGNLTEEDVDLRSIGFNQVEAIVTDQVDTGVIYLANEPVVLRAQGYDVNVIRVADYRDLVSNGLVTNETTIENEPEKVTAFIDALLKGIADTIDNPDEAYEISEKYVENLVDADETIQREVLAESIKLWETDRLGYSEPDSWDNMQQ
ncbi:MAG: ABC transporter substrate-binding protein, partial [Brevefilum sp.]